MALPKTIILKGDGIRKEAKVGASVITPGYLVARDSAGLLVPHATAATNAEKAFAVENELVGKGIDVDYAVSDNANYAVAAPGTEVYALLAAAAPAVVIGDFLESAGDGTIRKGVVDVATDTAQRAAIVAVAVEAVDNSGGGAEARIRISVV